MRGKCEQHRGERAGQAFHFSVLPIHFCWRHAATDTAAGKHSPALRDRRALEHFIKPRTRAARSVRRQRIGSEEAEVHDLAWIARAALLPEGADYEHRHMIAARGAAVEEYAVQRGRFERRDPGLLEQFAV